MRTSIRAGSWAAPALLFMTGGFAHAQPVPAPQTIVDAHQVMAPADTTPWYHLGQFAWLGIPLFVVAVGAVVAQTRWQRGRKIAAACGVALAVVGSGFAYAMLRAAHAEARWRDESAARIRQLAEQAPPRLQSSAREQGSVNVYDLMGAEPPATTSAPAR